VGDSFGLIDETSCSPPIPTNGRTIAGVTSNPAWANDRAHAAAWAALLSTRVPSTSKIYPRVVTPSMARVYPRNGPSNGDLMERRAIEMIASSTHARMTSWGVAGAMLLLLYPFVRCMVFPAGRSAKTRVPRHIGYTAFNLACHTQSRGS